MTISHYDKKMLQQMYDDLEEDAAIFDLIVLKITWLFELLFIDFFLSQYFYA